MLLVLFCKQQSFSFERRNVAVLCSCIESRISPNANHPHTRTHSIGARGLGPIGRYKYAKKHTTPIETAPTSLACLIL